MIPAGTPEIMAALITALGGIMAATIAAVAAAVIGNQVLGRKRLEARLNLALHDIQFLLEVERQHCSLHRDREEQSYKILMRRHARNNGYRWSGKFTAPPRNTPT